MLRAVRLLHSPQPEVTALSPTSFDNITDLMQTFLDVQTRRAEVVAGNIANADTPDYKARELQFEDYLRDAVDRSSLPASIQAKTPADPMRVAERKGAAAGFDGNTVDPGKEMADMAQIGTNFNFGAKILQSRLRLLRTAIREGR